MAKYEFKPDSLGRGLMEKLYMTPRQRRRMTMWGSLSLLCVGLLVLQDVAFGKFRPLGGTVELLVAAVFMVCLLHGAENGGKFCIWMSLFYLFSGSAPGHFVVALIPVLAITASLFRQSYLQMGFPAVFLCTVGAVVIYELFSFGVGVFYGVTALRSLFPVVQTCINTTVCIPLLYPAVSAISRIGGETWNE